MPTITVKDIPEDLYAALKKKAAEHHRSINREVIHYIEEAVQRREINVEEVLEKARTIQRKVGKAPISEEILNEFKHSERPSASFSQNDPP